MEQILKLLKYLYGDDPVYIFHWGHYNGIRIDYENGRVLLIGRSDSRWGDEPDIFVDEMPPYNIRYFEDYLKKKALEKAQWEIVESYLQEKLEKICLS